MRFQGLRFCIGVVVAVVFSLTLASSAGASHPYHVSVAELNWNSRSNAFEVAMCVWPADLEKAVSRQQGTPVDLDLQDNVDPLIEQYVQSRFSICHASDPKPVAGKFRWVGHQRDLKQAWLFFEISIPSDGEAARSDKTSQGWVVENRIFFELNDDQMNHVQFSVDGKYRLSQSLSRLRQRLEIEPTSR